MFKEKILPVLPVVLSYAVGFLTFLYLHNDSKMILPDMKLCLIWYQDSLKELLDCVEKTSKRKENTLKQLLKILWSETYAWYEY